MNLCIKGPEGSNGQNVDHEQAKGPCGKKDNSTLDCATKWVTREENNPSSLFSTNETSWDILDPALDSPVPEQQVHTAARPKRGNQDI